MKHIILFAISILFTIQSSYADTYQIYSFEKSVYVRKGKNNWQQAKKKSQLNSNDSIILGANACVKLFDVSSGLIYEWKEQGKYEVCDIINECLSRKSNWLHRLFSTLMENVTDEPDKLWGSTGSTRRGNKNDVMEHSLAKKLISYCYGFCVPSCDLILSPQYVSKNELYFDITNNTSDTLYVNVLAVNIKQESFTIIYDIRKKDKWRIFPVLPKSTLSLPDFTMSDNKNYKYVVFGTSKPAKIKDLEEYLNVDVLDDIAPIRGDVVVIGTERK